MGQKNILAIEEVLHDIRAHPDYSASVTRKVMERLREDSDRHSSALEAETGEYVPTKAIEKFKTYSYKNLLDARGFIQSNGITSASLSCWGNILEPDKNPRRNFRQTHVIFGEFEGEEPQKIIYKIEDLVGRVNDQEIHPIERAIDAHISLIQIHPYADGNGRAARLIQDICLERQSYPPGIISVSDRKQYICLMSSVLRDRKKNTSSVYKPSEKEALFHDFVESKILASAKKLREELGGTKVYEVFFSDINSPGAAMGAKHLLIGNSARPLCVHLETDKRADGARYTLKGSINLEELTHRAERIARKYRTKYTCIPK